VGVVGDRLTAPKSVHSSISLVWSSLSPLSLATSTSTSLPPSLHQRHSVEPLHPTPPTTIRIYTR